MEEEMNAQNQCFVFEEMPSGILQTIVRLLQDPQSVCRFGATCTTMKRVVDGLNVNEENNNNMAVTSSIWDAFLERIPQRARPILWDGAEPRSSREDVLRFASASLFAERMEILAPQHRVMLGEGQYCSGCSTFPDAVGCTSQYIEEVGGDVEYFARYSLNGSLLWQGFLKHRFCGNGDIQLGNETHGNDAHDLSDDLDWPELKAYLAHPPPRNELGFIDDESPTFRREKAKMASEMYSKLTLTIVSIHAENIGDPKLCISTKGLDKDNLGPDGYCSKDHMEIMPILSHGIHPVEPMADRSFIYHPYYRTSEDERHYSGCYVAVGHYYVHRWVPGRIGRDRLPDRYVGPVLGVFEPRSDED